MGRPVVLSNGQLFVGIDEFGLVHDFYYPYVGLENLTNARTSHHKIGVWVDGVFSWIDDGKWNIMVEFESDSLISHITAWSEQLKLRIVIRDFIDEEYNSLIRRIEIINETDKERDIRLFMHQVFQISHAGRGDTALYVPDEPYILDYKGRYCLLISGKQDDGASFDQYAVGIYGIEGKEGTFIDAEDGELSGNAVEHGGVDSVIRFQKKVGPSQSFKIDYWVVAGSSQTDLEHVHEIYRASFIEDRMRHVRQGWQSWINAEGVPLTNRYRHSLLTSTMVVKAHCDARGSVLASGDSSIFNYGRDYYCYCWPRDAAFALWPLIRLGHYDEAKQFFEFARDTMHPGGYLMHKYQPDRAIGSTWHPLIHGKRKELAIQEDETASVIFVLGQYYLANKDTTFVTNLYQSFVVPMANFMCNFIDDATGLPHASYDLWEEKFLTSTYSVCMVIAGLEMAAVLGEVANSPADVIRWQRAAQNMRDNLDKLYVDDSYFAKGFLLNEDGSLTIDKTLDISSLYGTFMFSGLEMSDPRIQSTGKLVEERLFNRSPSGGVIRYEDDSYFLSKREYKGNPWAISSLWLSQYWSLNNRNEEALTLLKWVLDRELPSGVLSEQFDPETGAAISVTPLVWSHAELINTLLDFQEFLS
jgi:glucoamylase